jgi:ribosomal protein S6
VVDVSPEGLKEAERILRADEGVIRFHTVRAETAIERFGAKNYKNPYSHIDLPGSLGMKVKTPKV